MTLPGSRAAPLRVEALVRAAGDGVRLGAGPKAFVSLAGAPLLEWALRTIEGVVDAAFVAVPTGWEEEARSICGSRATVVTGGARRTETTAILAALATAPRVLLHDVVHPFASSALARTVLDAVRDHEAAAPVVRIASFLYGPDGRRIATPGVGAAQNPVAFQRHALSRVLGSVRGDDAGSALDAIVATGGSWAQVPGDPANLKITTPADLRLAERMVQGDRPAWLEVGDPSARDH